LTISQKNILIIGGSSGIGLELVKHLSAQGANIYTAGRKETPFAVTAHQHLDVRDRNFQLQGLPDVLHGFVYCPGTINLKPFHRISAEELQDDLQVNFVGAFQSLQQCLSRLKASGNASVVLFSTVAAETGMAFHASIGAAKGAIEGLTRSLAAECAPIIRVNAIAPSLTDTPLAQKLLSSDDKRTAAAARHALKRVGTAEDMANMAAFLLSDASNFMTGQILKVDGGMGNLK
jgi:3-oxoacyl-[acyl-carrier protein] reductase